MPFAIKVEVTTIENSLGIILPPDMLEHLRVAPGDTLFAHETPCGVELTASEEAHPGKGDATENVI